MSDPVRLAGVTTGSPLTFEEAIRIADAEIDRHTIRSQEPIIMSPAALKAFRAWEAKERSK